MGHSRSHLLQVIFVLILIEGTCSNKEQVPSLFIGEEPVPDSFVDIAWKLTSDDVIGIEIFVVSDFEFWTTSDFLGAQLAGTGVVGI